MEKAAFPLFTIRSRRNPNVNYPPARVKGTLRPDGSLDLDERPDLPPGRVQVVVTSEESPDATARDTKSVLERIWRERVATGMVGRTRGEIDASIGTLRDELEEHMVRTLRDEFEEHMVRLDREREATLE